MEWVVHAVAVASAPAPPTAGPASAAAAAAAAAVPAASAPQSWPLYLVREDRETARELAKADATALRGVAWSRLGMVLTGFASSPSASASAASGTAAAGAPASASASAAPRAAPRTAMLTVRRLLGGDRRGAIITCAAATALS
jgi:hypothetical protein